MSRLDRNDFSYGQSGDCPCFVCDACAGSPAVDRISVCSDRVSCIGPTSSRTTLVDVLDQDFSRSRARDVVPSQGRRNAMDAQSGADLHAEANGKVAHILRISA